MNIGNRPTVDGKNQTIEVHFFDFNQDGLMDFAASIANGELHVFTNAGPTPGSLPPNQALGVVDLPSNGVTNAAGKLQERITYGQSKFLPKCIMSLCI